MPIWPDMQNSVALFLDATWKWLPTFGPPIRTHIIRSELEASARLLGIDNVPALFPDIRVMEDEALRYWSRKK